MDKFEIGFNSRVILATHLSHRLRHAFISVLSHIFVLLLLLGGRGAMLCKGAFGGLSTGLYVIQGMFKLTLASSSD